MPDPQQILGFRPDLTDGATVINEPADSASITIELGEIASAVMRREKVDSISLSDDARAALVERVERAQAARGAVLARQAWEARPLAPAPGVSPDTMWSGDLGTLLELCNIGVRRMRHTYVQRARGYGRTHEQP